MRLFLLFSRSNFVCETGLVQARIVAATEPCDSEEVFSSQPSGSFCRGCFLIDRSNWKFFWLPPDATRSSCCSCSSFTNLFSWMRATSSIFSFIFFVLTSECWMKSIVFFSKSFSKRVSMLSKRRLRSSMVAISTDGVVDA